MENVDAPVGLVVVETRESEQFDIQVSSVLHEGVEYKVTRIRSKNSKHENFLVKLVTTGDRVVWSHDDSGYTGIALFAMTRDGPLVLLCKDHYVHRIVPFVHKDYFDDIVEHADIKQEAAELIGYEPWYTDNERRARMLNHEINLLSECELKHRRYIETREARAVFVQRVMKRAHITVTTQKGLPRRGVPVLAGELSMLPTSTPAVLVEDLNRPWQTAQEVFDVAVNVRGIVERQHVQQVARH